MKKLLFLSLAFISLIIVSCKDDDAPLPDNTLNFSTTEIGMDESESLKSFTISIDRATTASVKVVLGLTESGVTYAQEYTTTPAASNGQIEITIAAGQTSASVSLTKVANALFDGDETVKLSLKTISDTEVLQGTATETTVSFGAIVSGGSELTLNGGEGGSSAANSVFVDFSNNEQTSVARKSWNLGFYCGSEFAVILNNTTISTAKEVNIGIDAIVSSADSAKYATALALTYTADNFALLDDWAGDLTKTVIKADKVYVVNLGESQTPLYKVKVSQKDNNTYTLQYAKINESTVKSIDVVKDSKYSFVYVSFAENKTVAVAPQKAKWDIEWTKTLYQTASGSATIPYSYADFVLINAKDGAQAVEVLTSVKAYADFTKSDVASLTFGTSVDVIGSKWRSGGGPTSQPSVKTDRFYVVKDSAGNIYKLQFVSMGAGDGGTRGYPQIKYALLK